METLFWIIVTASIYAQNTPADMSERVQVEVTAPSGSQVTDAYGSMVTALGKGK